MPSVPSVRRLTGHETFPALQTPLLVERVAVQTDVIPHDHDFYEIVLIAAGTARHRSQAGDVALRPGDLMILRPGAWHVYQDCNGLILYNCCFGPELLRRELAAATHDPAVHYLFWGGPLSLDRQGLIRLPLTEAQYAECAGALDQLIAARGRALAQIGGLLLLLDCLAACMGAEYRSAAETARPLHPAVPRCQTLLEERLDHPWTLAELADTLHLDPSYLVRLFKAGVGLAPIAYLNRSRAERAASLLLRTRRPIAEIAEEVGWPDANYFARRFRAVFGMSASAYRAQFARPQNGPQQV